MIFGGAPDDGEGNEINNNDEFGICFEDCELGDAYILGNVIHENGMNDDDDENPMLCGLQIIDSDPIFVNNTKIDAAGRNYIYENSVTGVYLFACEPYWSHNDEDDADVIAGNGRQFDPQAGLAGAEVYHDGGTTLTI